MCPCVFDYEKSDLHHLFDIYFAVSLVDCSSVIHSTVAYISDVPTGYPTYKNESLKPHW